MRRALIVAVLLAVAAVAAYWKLRPAPAQYEQAYAGDDHATVWSSTAQVKVPVGTLQFGEPVEILGSAGENTHIRRRQGAEGWVETRKLLSAEDWTRAIGVSAQAKAMPVMGRGHARVPTNLRLEPGRDGTRLLQLAQDAPVALLGRKVAAIPGSGENGEAPKKEDWWEVRAKVKDAGEVGGWVLARFIAPDLPKPLPEYASAAGMRVVAWFALSQVVDEEGKEKPQYLVAGTKSAEGEPCDFTMLRVFTWGKERSRYETAYVESELCGMLPLEVRPASVAGGASSFGFEDVLEDGTKQRREYRMVQTQVRLVSGGDTRMGKKGKRRKSKP